MTAMRPSMKACAGCGRSFAEYLAECPFCGGDGSGAAPIEHRRGDYVMRILVSLVAGAAIGFFGLLMIGAGSLGMATMPAEDVTAGDQWFAAIWMIGWVAVVLGSWYALLRWTGKARPAPTEDLFDSSPLERSGGAVKASEVSTRDWVIIGVVFVAVFLYVIIFVVGG